MTDASDMDAIGQTKDSRLALRLLLQPGVLLASMGGAGFCPVAPGTVGALIAFPLVSLLSGFDVTFKCIVYALFAMATVWAITATRDVVGHHDHSIVISDETLAMALVLECIPGEWSAMLLGFVLFRLFDIVKPWPANVIERRMCNGFGVLGDDLVAAAYAIVLVRVVQPFLPI